MGAEGQLLLGALAATGVALHGGAAGREPGPALMGQSSPWPAPAPAPGALWALRPGPVACARLGASGIVTTLMLNYVAALLVGQFVVFGPWSEGGFQLTPRSRAKPGCRASLTSRSCARPSPG